IEFKPLPRSRDATNNRNAVLRCGVFGPGATDYKISWIVDAKNVTSNSRRFQRGNNLHFEPIDKDFDSGEFQCVATLKNNSRVEMISVPSAKFNIKWVEAESVDLRSPRLKTDVLPGVRVVLRCSINGNPKPSNISWLVNGAVLNTAPTGVEIRNRRLIIASAVLKANDGVYTCCALSHPLGKRCTPQERGFSLQVIDRRIPVLTRGPQSQIVKKNSDVSFSCEWEADPLPVVTWYYDDVNSRPLTNKSSSEQCRKRCIFPNGTMLLRNVRENQVGTYYCKAGDADDLVASATLSLAAIKQFRQRTIDMYFTEGENFEFTCQPPDALPPATIEWYHRDRRVGSPGHIFRTMNILVIDDPRKSDEGTYTCVAVNKAGSVNMTLVLTLAVEPSIDLLTNKHVNEGLNLSWICPGHGVPEPDITWYKDGKPVVDKNRFICCFCQAVRGSELRIDNLEISDGGSYSCSASNRAGSTQSARSNRAQLIVNGKHPVPVAIAPGYSTLILESPNLGDSGTYVCSATDTSSGNSLTQSMKVRVVQPPHVIHPPMNRTLYEGERVIFDCGVEPSLANLSHMEWRFHGLVLTSSDPPTRGNPFRVFPNGTLAIRRARFDDEGFYACEYRTCDFRVLHIAELTVVKEGNGGDKANATQMIQTIALSVSGGVAYILVTVALIIYCRSVLRSSILLVKGKNGGIVEEEMKMLNGSCSACNGDGRMRSNHDDELMTSVNLDLSQLSHDVASLQYPAENVEPLRVIGKGRFGEIFLSKAPGIFPELEEDILVMVKSFDTCDTSKELKLRAEFNREINTLHRAHHDHVVKLLAISSREIPERADLLITEYLEWGILKLCLQASKDGKIPKFTKNHKMNMCCQLSSGLDHLHKLDLLHGDVATRNCVVSSHLLIKISMLGLSKEGFENEYVQWNDKPLPLRWLPPEALLGGSLTPKSDVFMFGVTCWEIFTLGEFPHSDMSNDALVKAMQSNQVPSLPALESTKRITSLINKCCHSSPSNRPEMKQISRKLESITSGEVK
uniref:Receptor protein-tyrosine kinase n=1 Tax=Ciona savignyi TaxID=51511 RepID=H2ZF87_CIOSA